MHYKIHYKTHVLHKKLKIKVFWRQKMDKKYYLRQKSNIVSKYCIYIASSKGSPPMKLSWRSGLKLRAVSWRPRPTVVRASPGEVFQKFQNFFFLVRGNSLSD